MKRGAKWALGIGIGAVVLAGAAVVTEVVLRQVVPNTIEGHVREFLNLSDDHPVEVTVSGSHAAQLVRGHVSGVTVSVPDAPLPGGLRADLYAESERVPFDPTTAELGNTVIGARFTEEQLTGVLALIGRGIGQDIEIEQTHLTITHAVTVFGQRIPFSLSLTPSANEGALRVTPVAFDAGPFTLTPEHISGIPWVNQLADGLDICIADRLPRGVTLTSIELTSTRAFAAEAVIHPRIGIDPALQALGNC